MAIAITITDKDCAKCVNLKDVGRMFMEAYGIEDEPKRVRVAYNGGTSRRMVEVQFEREAHALSHRDLAELMGCDCAVVGQSGTEWYVCGFNK